MTTLHRAAQSRLFLVERFAAIAWRLRRVPYFEAALMTYVAAEVVSVFDDDPFQDTVELPALDDAYSIGRMFRVMLSQDLTGKLTRYEASLQKQLSQMLRDLEKLRERTPRPYLGLQERGTSRRRMSSCPMNPQTHEVLKPARPCTQLAADATKPAPPSTLTMCDARGDVNLD